MCKFHFSLAVLYIYTTFPEKCQGVFARFIFCSCNFIFYSQVKTFEKEIYTLCAFIFERYFVDLHNLTNFVILKAWCHLNAKESPHLIGTATLAKVDIYFFFLTSLSFFSAALMIICIVFSLA